MRIGLLIDAGLILAIATLAQALPVWQADGEAGTLPATGMAEICRVLPSGDIADCTIQN